MTLTTEIRLKFGNRTNFKNAVWVGLVFLKRIERRLRDRITHSEVCKVQL